MRKLSCEMFELMAKGLNIQQRDVFSKLVRDEESDLLFRLNHFPRCPQGKGMGCNLTRFGEHTDPKLIISVMRSNNTKGLQIFLRYGNWISVPPNPSCFFNNVGDSLQAQKMKWVDEGFEMVVVTGHFFVSMGVVHLLELLCKDPFYCIECHSPMTSFTRNDMVTAHHLIFCFHGNLSTSEIQEDNHVKDSDAEMLSVHVELFLGKVAEWSQVIHALDCIDVLQAFTVAAMSSTGSMSRPVLSANSHPVVSCQENGGAIMKVKGLWHPYAVGENGGGLVPNDIHLCHDSSVRPCALLLTGPNMGGKSTLLRATCLAVILAQLGCYVPCDMCILSPVDVIFTRLGSMDRIMSGEIFSYRKEAQAFAARLNLHRPTTVLLEPPPFSLRVDESHARPTFYSVQHTTSKYATSTTLEPELTKS